MHLLVLSFLLVCLAFFPSCAARAMAAQRILVPEPQQCFWKDGFDFVFGEETHCVIVPLSEDGASGYGMGLLASELHEYLGIEAQFPSQGNPVAATAPRILLGLAKDAGNGHDEGYSLFVEAGAVRLLGHDERGLVNGIMTILQLAYKSQDDRKIHIPAIEIHDWPDMSKRSYFFELNANGDQAGQYSFEWLRRCVRRLCGYYKCNMVGLGEAGAGCFPLKKYPFMQWQPRGLSEKQLRELVAEARKYGMDAYPVIEIFGHAEGLFVNHNKVETNLLKTIAVKGGARFFDIVETDEEGGVGNAVCLSSPELRDIARDIFDSVCDIFDTPEYFHIGMDEATPVGTCPRCRGQNTAELFADYLNWCRDELVKRGVRHVMMWSDELLDHQQFPHAAANSNLQRKVNWFGMEKMANYVTHPALDALNRDMVIVYWDYSGKAPEPIPFLQEKGFTVWAAPWKDDDAAAATVKDAAAFDCPGMMGTAWTFSYWRGATTTAAAETAWNTKAPLRDFDRNTRLHLDMLPPRPSEFHNTACTPIPLQGNAERTAVFLADNIHCPKALPQALAIGNVSYSLDERIIGIAAGQEDERLHLPEKEYLDIHSKATGLAFLQSGLGNHVLWESVLATMVVCYEDGTRESVPIQNGINIGALQTAPPDERLIRMAYGWTTDARLVEWPAGDVPLQFQSWEWQNPHPEKMIDHLEWTMGDGGKALLVFAVSLIQ